MSVKVRVVKKLYPKSQPVPADTSAPETSTYIRENEHEGWMDRDENQKYEEAHWVENYYNMYLVYPHEFFRVDCPVHGDAYLVRLRTGVEPRVEFSCGCVWHDGGSVGASKLAGFYREEDKEPLTTQLLKRAVAKSAGVPPQKVAVRPAAPAVAPLAAPRGKKSLWTG